MAAIALVAAYPAAAQSVASPGGAVTLVFGTNADSQPTYSVSVGGRVVIAPSRLGLEFERYAKLSNGLVVTGVDRRDGEDRYTLVAGKTAAVDERYREIVVHLAEPGARGAALDVVARAYDTGVALRYRIPARPGAKPLRIVDELTTFAFPADYACTGLNLGTFGTSHEGEFDPVAASRIRPTNLYDLPLVCRTGAKGPVLAFAEADVDDWPVAYLTGTETGALGAAIKLSRRVDEPGIAVKADRDRDRLTPWRVIMIAPETGKLIENTLLTSLNPPAQGDFAWVKPGKTAWDWWSGPILAAVPHAGTNDATEKAFIDFAATMRLEYMMIDDGWYANSGDGADLNPGADPTRPIPAIHLPALVDYAARKGVGLVLWVHWQLLDRDMDHILTQIERWGIKGIKVDFMNRDDQEMVGFYHRLAAATARHHLLLDLHGATHPWGMTRTWPNFITQEGVMGAEYNKWTRRVTARHNVSIAFTRMVAGPMDYTPGGFRNHTPKTFAPAATGPQTQTTRGAALAMYVVYESPLQSVADSPDAYRGGQGVDFLTDVPSSWDETRFLAGDLGTFVAVARRKGDRWYVGAMTDAARTITLPLGFLGRGRFLARTWEDGATATSVRTGERGVTAGGTLTLRLAASGGGVATLSPVPNP